MTGLLWAGLSMLIVGSAMMVLCLFGALSRSPYARREAGVLCTGGAVFMVLAMTTIGLSLVESP